MWEDLWPVENWDPHYSGLLLASHSSREVVLPRGGFLPGHSHPNGTSFLVAQIQFSLILRKTRSSDTLNLLETLRENSLSACYFYLKPNKTAEWAARVTSVISFPLFWAEIVQGQCRAETILGVQLLHINGTERKGPSARPVLTRLKRVWGNHMQAF